MEPVLLSEYVKRIPEEVEAFAYTRDKTPTVISEYRRGEDWQGWALGWINSHLALRKPKDKGEANA